MLEGTLKGVVGYIIFQVKGLNVSLVFLVFLADFRKFFERESSSTKCHSPLRHPPHLFGDVSWDNTPACLQVGI